MSTLSPDLQEMSGKDSLNAFLYADDTLLVGVSQQNTQALLDAVAQSGANYGMELHWNKFQLLQVGGIYHFSAPDGIMIAPTGVMTY